MDAAKTPTASLCVDPRHWPLARSHDLSVRHYQIALAQNGDTGHRCGAVRQNLTGEGF